jgi:hypothetical protein
MAWTYDANALDEPLNSVRMLVGDTNEYEQLLQDEEIEAFIAITDSNVSAAALAARALSAKYARSVDKWVGDLKILASQKQRQFLHLYEQLTLTASSHGVPSAGGIRVSQKEAQAGDGDLVSPAFRIGMHDNIGSEE